MIWYLADVSDNPTVLLVFASAFLVALFTGLAFHEFCHAWTANELGDDTAKRAGRLTLNPIVHIDPMGAVMLLLLGFGRAKPTPVNPYRLRTGPVIGHAIVAFAGPASNFFFAALAAIPLRFGLIETQYGSIESLIRFGSGEDYIWLFLYFIVSLNVLLGIFNLLPIPPLDGFAVFLAFVPSEFARTLRRIEPYGIGILMSLFIVGFITNGAINPLGWLIGGAYSQVFRLLV